MFPAPMCRRGASNGKQNESSSLTLLGEMKILRHGIEVGNSLALIAVEKGPEIL